MIGGDWTFADNVINRSGQDGININRALDSTSRFVFTNNNLSDNIRDGLHMNDYDGERFFFADNVTNSNSSNGMNLVGFRNGGGPSDWVFLRSTSGGNGAAGIRIEDARGKVDFLDVTIQNNIGSGIQLVDFRNQRANDHVRVGVLNFASNSISGNGTGAGAGVESVLNVGRQDLIINNTLLNDNGVGVLARANNALTVMNTSIIENDAISNNNDDGIRIVASNGATHNVEIRENTGRLNMNNNGISGGHGISLLAEHGGGTTSTINADITGVDFTGTGAAPTDAAIFGLTDRNALLNVNITDVNVTTTSGSGFLFDLGANNTAISNIDIRSVNITGAGDNGMDFQLSRTQFADIQLAASTITGSGTNGINYTAAGDTRSRFTGLGNTITGSGQDGLNFSTFGTAEMLLVLTSNQSQTNGRDGMFINAGGNSVVSARMTNNNLSQNGEFGLFMRTSDAAGGGAGTLAVLMDRNVVSNNDTTAVTGRDMNASNSSLGQLCLAMTNNFFVLPVRLENLGAPADFVVELDGSTNGIGVPQIFDPTPADFDLRAFGAVCEPFIVAQEGVFTGLGF